jgi:hypothetical protein
MSKTARIEIERTRIKALDMQDLRQGLKKRS